MASKGKAKYVVSPHQLEQQRDWTKCIICQEDSTSSGKLLCPADSKNRSNLGAGYVSLVEDVTAFEKSGLPGFFEISKLDDGNGIKETLLRLRAKFHSSCRLKFSKARFQRAMKRERSDVESDAPTAAKSLCSEQHDEPHSKMKKYYDTGETRGERPHIEHHS